MKPVCKDSDCDREAYLKGFCRHHYQIDRTRRAPFCSVPGCDRKQRTKGLCSGHYDRTKKPNPDLVSPIRPCHKFEPGAICSHKDCKRPAFVRKLCQMHNARRLRGTPMDQALPNRYKPGELCIQKDCNRPAKAKGFCIGHYERMYYGSPIDPPFRVHSPKSRSKISEDSSAKMCEIPDCSRNAVTRGLCSSHYQRQRRGNPRTEPIGKLPYNTPRQRRPRSNPT